MTFRLRNWQHVLAVALPGLCGAGLMLLAKQQYALDTLGTGLLLLAAAQLLSSAARALRRDASLRMGPLHLSRLPSVLPIVGLVVVAMVLLWPTMIGRMPLSQDHTVHLTRAWHFVSEMLGRGQLSGWSDLWFAGWPAGEDYPPGADWWTGALYLATFGLLGWEATYGLAFTAMFAVSGLAVYHFGKTYFNRIAGLLAGLFFILDRGQYREGGWNYTVWWGVWPQILATAFFVLSLSTLDRVLRRGEPRDFVVCALCSGFAIISHPVSVIYFGLAVPIYLCCRVLGSDEPAGRVVVRSVAALGLGAALGAFWVLPYSAKGAWMAKYGELWKSLPAMASDIWRGTLFQNGAPPLIWLALLGGALAAYRRNFVGIFLAALAAVVLFISSSTAFQQLGLLELSPAFGQVQFQRLSIVAKICVFLLAAYTLQQLFRSSGFAGDPSAADREEVSSSQVRRYFRRYALTGLLLLAVAPFVEPLARNWGRTFGAEVGQPKTRRDFAHYNDYQRFLTWSRELRQLEKEFFRIAYVRPYNDHFFAAAPVFNGIAAYKVGYTPCTTFIHKPDTADPDLYRVLSVKYVVGIGRVSGEHLELEKSFGAIRVYRNTAYSARRYTLNGGGRVEVEIFEPEQVRLKISGAGEGGRLILHRANYPNWRAFHDGAAVPIETAALANHKIFISVPAKNGTIELRYGWPAINVVGALLSWLAVGTILFLVLRRFYPRVFVGVRQRLSPWGMRLERHGVAVGVTIALLAPLALALKSRDPDEALQRGSLLRQLDGARVELLRGGSATPCARKKKRFQCSSQSWNYVGEVSYRVEGQFRRCIWAHPVQGAQLRIAFSRIALGRTLEGHHGILDDAVRSFASGAPVSLAVAVDGKVLQTLVRPNTRGWTHFAIDTSAYAGQQVELSFTVTARSAGGRHYCFEASVVR